MSDRVGIRELRQNLSVYLRRVEAGETLEVTERGKPVALLAPLPGRQSILDRLIAEGKARPARAPWSVPPASLPPVAPGEKAMSDVLQELREDRL